MQHIILDSKFSFSGIAKVDQSGYFNETIIGIVAIF